MEQLSTYRVEAITTPIEAVTAMTEAGAVFKVQPSNDMLGVRFSYAVEPGGDRDRCRAILASVKARPPQFLQAFQVEVRRRAGSSR